MIGPGVRQLAVAYWARFGCWPETLTLTLAGQPVPPDLVREAEAARLLEQKRQAERDARPSGLLAEEEGLLA